MGGGLREVCSRLCGLRSPEGYVKGQSQGSVYGEGQGSISQLSSRARLPSFHLVHPISPTPARASPWEPRPSMQHSREGRFCSSRKLGQGGTGAHLDSPNLLSFSLKFHTPWAFGRSRECASSEQFVFHGAFASITPLFLLPFPGPLWLAPSSLCLL